MWISITNSTEVRCKWIIKTRIYISKDAKPSKMLNSIANVAVFLGNKHDIKSHGFLFCFVLLFIMLILTHEMQISAK